MTRREIAFSCPTCHQEVCSNGEEEAVCPHCNGRTRLELSPALRSGGPVDRCPACGSERLYVQRDFNQRAGLAVVVLGAVAAPFTHYLSLLGAAVLDALLYLWLPEITVCYRCAAHFRGYPRNPAHLPFDLHIAEQYGKRVE